MTTDFRMLSDDALNQCHIAAVQRVATAARVRRDAIEAYSRARHEDEDACERLEAIKREIRRRAEQRQTGGGA